MKKTMESAYREFASIAGCPWAMKEKVTAMEKLYGSLGGSSVIFDNMVYESIGMSADEVLDMLDVGDTLS